MKTIICLILIIFFFTTIGTTLENSYDKDVGKFSYEKVDNSNVTTTDTVAKHIVKMKIYDEDIDLEKCQEKKAITLKKLKTDYNYLMVKDGNCSKTLSYKDIKDINTCNKTFEDIPKYIEVNKEAHLSLKRALCKEKKDAIKVYSYQVIAEARFKNKLSYKLESLTKTVPYFFSGVSIIILGPFYIISYFL